MNNGVPESDTWPSQLQQLSGMTVANLGHAGSSNDTAFRFAEYYLKFLNPKYAIWQQTDAHRFELIDDLIPLSLNILATDTANPCANDYYTKIWVGSSSNHRLNLSKNTLAFEQICKSLNIIPIILPRRSVNSDCSARDLKHPGKEVYKVLAKQFFNLLGQWQ